MQTNPYTQTLTSIVIIRDETACINKYAPIDTEIIPILTFHIAKFDQIDMVH